MAKVFFLGCNYDQVPYLTAARKLGFTVIGTDRNPDAPGAKLSDRFYDIGYTDIYNLRKMAEIEGWCDEDKIFTAAAHFAYEGAARLAEELNLTFLSPTSVDTCIDKVKFYAMLKENDVSVPPTVLYDTESSFTLDKRKVYFLKSDYGKSPNYCYRIVDGKIPPLPKEHDSFYRNVFLVQEEIKGVHFRLNLYAGQSFVFMKFSDTAAVPVSVLGPGHAVVIRKLQKVVSALGAENLLTKFDLIVNEDDCYVIDIGLDPPMRLTLLCEYLGIDFPYAYTRSYLLNDTSAMPLWEDICKPVVIKGTPQTGFEFIEVGEAEK